MGKPRWITCATCGTTMHGSATSLPQGQATCRPCRRKSPEYAKRQQALARVTSLPVLTGTCAICCGLFKTKRANQKYCSASCRESRRRWTDRDSMLTADERGYGREHREVRKQWAPIVARGEAACCLCGYDIDPGEAWHLDHTPDRDGYRGAAHAECNIRDGATRGGARGNRNRSEVERQCEGCGSGFVTVYARQRYCSSECRPKRPPRWPVTNVAFLVCIVCGLLFTTRSTTAKYCAGHRGYQPKRTAIVCQVCGTRALSLNGETKMYCGPACAKRAYRKSPAGRAQRREARRRARERRLAGGYPRSLARHSA